MPLFDANSRDRLQVFIDGQNLFGTLRALDMKIDYKAFMDTLKAETRLVRVQYFTTIRADMSNGEKLNKVLEFLDHNGYQLVTKEARESMDSYGHARTKGTMMVEMATQMLMAAMNGTDHIVVMSGDGELTAAVEACKLLDCRTTVVSSERTRIISDDLRRACDNFVDIENLPKSIVDVPEYQRA